MFLTDIANLKTKKIRIMINQIRPLNKKGREDYLRWVLSLKDDPNLDIPHELLSDPDTSMTQTFLVI